MFYFCAVTVQAPCHIKPSCCSGQMCYGPVQCPYTIANPSSANLYILYSVHVVVVLHIRLCYNPYLTTDIFTGLYSCSSIPWKQRHQHGNFTIGCLLFGNMFPMT